MGNGNRLLTALIAVNKISLDRKIAFEIKLQKILSEIVSCLQAKSGSIMLLRGRKNLEVVASTVPEITGLKQPLDEDSPSSWVVKNKTPLLVDNISKNNQFMNRFNHYKGMAFLLVPIVSEKKVIGVLNVTDKVGEDIFSAEEQETLLNIASQVISALDNQHLTDSLKQKKKILQKKNLELKKLEKLKTDLFNMLIHDLKGPLSEMVANLDILSYILEGENLDYLKAAQTGCDTLFRMVSNLLDIARLEESKLDLVFEILEPRDVLKESIGRMFGLAKMKDLKISEEYPATGNFDPFRGDREVFLRVLQNLLSNAIQYSPYGETITLGFKYLDDGKIEFFVKDNGPGIPPEYQEVVFDKYKQLEKKADGRVYTTGLGLAFCKMAVDAHKGRIRAISDGVKGSCFTIILPIP